MQFENSAQRQSIKKHKNLTTKQQIPDFPFLHGSYKI